MTSKLGIGFVTYLAVKNTKYEKVDFFRVDHVGGAGIQHIRAGQ